MKKKSEIITFKADETLLEAIKGVENRSRFIREAILAALENVCPLCQGVGILSVNQRRHWDRFARYHSLQECDDCHEVHLVCNRTRKGKTDRRQPH